MLRASRAWLLGYLDAELDAAEESLKQDLMKLLRSSPVRALLFASSLHDFIFCCDG